MKSCLYVGRVRHRRLRPLPHEFEYPLYMTLLDLGELDEIFRGRWLWSAHRAAPVRFRRLDHFGDPGEPLDESARRFVQERGGFRPEGPVRLLTHLRHFGFVFNPVSFLFLYDRLGTRLEAVIFEVSNTPWNERHLYFLDARGRAPENGSCRFEQRKEFHVSPFMGMAALYRFLVTPPGETLSIRIESDVPEGRLFEASLSLTRRPITTRSLASTLARFPAMTARVMLAIHWQALRLWIRGVPIHPHPERPRV